MKINFNILNQEIDLTEALKKDKEWFFKNSNPEIPIDTKIEDLTKDQKIALIRLAIEEGYLESEILMNLPHKSFQINL